MIENENELAITREWRDKFKAAMDITIKEMPETTENERLRKQFYSQLLLTSSGELA